MKILFYRYNNICEPDIIQAFQELGHLVIEENTEIYNKDIPAKILLDNVKSFLFSQHFDFVFSINFYPVLSEICNIFQIPYLCWTVDSPVLELYSHSICNPYNRIFLFDYAQYNEFVAYNPTCIFYLPLATNSKRWEQVFSNSNLQKKNNYQHTISFVGSLYREKCPYDKLKNPPEYLNGYLNALMDFQEQVYGDYLIENLLTDDIVKEFKQYYPDFYQFPDRSSPNDKAVLAQLYMGNKITSNERVHLLQALSTQYPVDLYTGSNTSDIPTNNHGFASSHEQMPFIFRQSKINLNITVRGIRSGIPLRVWDVLGCGGFLLTNYQPEIPEYFVIGEDLDIYQSKEDLLEKTEYYLTHEEERKEIAYNGYQKVSANHTYLHRIMTMLSLAFPS